MDESGNFEVVFHSEQKWVNISARGVELSTISWNFHEYDPLACIYSKRSILILFAPLWVLHPTLDAWKLFPMTQ